MTQDKTLALTAGLALGLALALSTTGCARPWQIARTVLLTTADGLAAADAAVVDAYERSTCEGNTDLAELEACVSNLAATEEVLQGARTTLEEGEAIVDTWEQLREEPPGWQRWAASLSSTVAAILTSLEAFGIEVPPELRRALELLGELTRGV